MSKFDPCFLLFQKNVTMCYPGRGWSGTRCEPLLQHVSRATYILAMRLDIHVHVPSQKFTMSDIQDSIHKYLQSETILTGVSFTLELFPVAKEELSETETSVKTMLVMEFNLDNFNRSSMENNLFDVYGILLGFNDYTTPSPMKFEIASASRTLQVSSTEVNTLYFSSFENYLNRIDTQFKQNLNFVSELLFCEHKVIEHEYHYDKTSLSIQMNNGRDIPIGQFIRTTSGAIQVCSSYVSQHAISDKFRKAYIIMQYVSLGLHTCLLFVTGLITLFRRPRSLSLPYLCSLVSFLVLDQVVLILSDELVSSHTVCCVYGVLRHHCVLMVVLSLYFYGKSIIHEYKTPDIDNNPVHHYYRVIIIVPLTIVLINVVILKAVENEFGYCNGRDVCFLHVLPSVLLSLYLPCFLTLAVLYIEYMKAILYINRMQSTLFCSLILVIVCTWVTEALCTLKQFKIYYMSVNQF